MVKLLKFTFKRVVLQFSFIYSRSLRAFFALKMKIKFNKSRGSKNKTSSMYIYVRIPDDFLVWYDFMDILCTLTRKKKRTKKKKKRNYDGVSKYNKIFIKLYIIIEFHLHFLAKHKGNNFIFILELLIWFFL